MANDNPIQLDVTFQSTEPLEVNLGEMYKGGDSTFAGLSDVNFTDLQNGQIPKYNAETDKWENAEDTCGVTELSALDDVSLTSSTDGQILRYNSQTEKWENSDEVTPVSDLSDLSDVVLSSLTDGQALVYDAESGKWVNADVSSGVTDYRYLDELPQINGITLIGNKTAEDLHLTWEGTQAQYDAIVSKNPAVTYFITDGPKIIKDNIEYTAGGSGGIKRTVLMDTWNDFANGATITLSEDVDKFDELIIYASHIENNSYYAHRGIMRVDKESILWSISESAQSEDWRGLIDCIGSYQNNQVYSAFDFRFTDKRTIKSVTKTVGTWPYAQCGIEKVIGVKYS